ncbi:unnamed protein product, partial [Prorocentrum cordatum]
VTDARRALMVPPPPSEIGSAASAAAPEPSAFASFGWWLAPRALGSLGLLVALLAWRAETGRGSLMRLGLVAALIVVAAIWVGIQTVRGWWRAATGQQAEVEALRAQLASLTLDA